MIVWTQQSRYDMRPGEFMRQLEALEREVEPFSYGFRHIKPEWIRSHLGRLRRQNPLVDARLRQGLFDFLRAYESSWPLLEHDSPAA